MRITRLRSFMSADINRPRVLVALDSEDGLTGWGECYNHGPDRALPPLLDYLALQIAGEDARRIEYLMLKLQQQARFPPGALGLAAMSAIDHALWDLNGKALNVPVYQLLGGAVRDRVKVYQGLYTAPDVPEARDQILSLQASHGIEAVKLSPFRGDIHVPRFGEVVRKTAEYVGALRKAIPDSIELAFDAHAKLFEPHQAVQLGNALAPFDPLFYEEPIRPEHIPAWRALKSRLNVPLATGESLYNRYEFLALLTAQGADIIQPDICVVGGITEMRRIAAIAEAHFVMMAPHNPMGPLAAAINLHFCLACTNFKILEYRLPGGAYLDHFGSYHTTQNRVDGSYVVDPYVPVGGYLEPRPGRVGWGVEIDEAYLATDRYVHWERKLARKPDGSLAYP
ncbi:MAG: mandelate racemase/muconate lactonizing enzyme family protein [Bosea sp. (in: a-proteobacteria)]